MYHPDAAQRVRPEVTYLAEAKPRCGCRRALPSDAQRHDDTVCAYKFLEWVYGNFTNEIY
jgi:hypothetical protein